MLMKFTVNVYIFNVFCSSYIIYGIILYSAIKEMKYETLTDNDEYKSSDLDVDPMLCLWFYHDHDKTEIMCQ